MEEYNFDWIGNFPLVKSDSEKYIVFACAKNESDYITEWVKHYLSIGFDKIIIADNNDIGDDSLYNVLNDYIVNGRVQIFDCRGMESIQVAIYSKFCEYGNYKWCGYFDCDEFFEMGAYNNVKEFLSTLDEYDCISFNWLIFGPNGQSYKKEGSVQERFLKPVCPVLYMKENVFIKSIVKGGYKRFENCWFNGSHIPSTTNEEVKYSIGGYNEPYSSKTVHAHFPPSYKLGYIKHYYTKSYEEWEKKSRRGWPDGTENLDMKGFYLFNENHEIPVDNFLNGLFADAHQTGSKWRDIINAYSVIEFKNDGDFVYPFIMNVISIMASTTGHTFIFTDSHVDDTMYSIFLEYAFITGNKVCYARDRDEVWLAFLNNNKFNEPTYYILSYA